MKLRWETKQIKTENDIQEPQETVEEEDEGEFVYGKQHGAHTENEILSYKNAIRWSLFLLNQTK